MTDPTVDPARLSPRESTWPLVLGVSVAVLATVAVLVGRSGWLVTDRAQGGDAFAGVISALCRHADGTRTLLSQTHECTTSGALELQLQTTDPRAKYGGWMIMGNGQVSGGGLSFARGSAVSIPLTNAQPGPAALVGLLSDRTLDINNLYDYMMLEGEGASDAFGHLLRFERKVNQWRRGGQVIGVQSLTFRVRRG